MLAYIQYILFNVVCNNVAISHGHYIIRPKVFIFDFFLRSSVYSIIIIEKYNICF